MVVIRASTIQRNRNSTMPSIHEIFHASGSSDQKSNKPTMPSNFGKIVWMVLALLMFVLVMLLILNSEWDLAESLLPASETSNNDSNNLRTANSYGVTNVDSNANTESGKSQDVTTSESAASSSSSSSLEWKIPTAIDFDTCDSMRLTVIPQKPTWNTKPLWISGYPRSGGGSEGKRSQIDQILPPIIEQLTSRNVGKFEGGQPCLSGDSQVVGCLTSAPREKIAQPLRTRDRFNVHTVILTTRNIATAIPAAQHQNVYRGMSNQQVAQSQWLSFRDLWVGSNPEKTISKWSQSVTWWTNNNAFFDDYLIIPYEHLFDDTKGPKLIMKLARVLQKEGFDIVPENEILCIWYKTIEKERATQEEFFKYVPKYTQSQIEVFQRSLTTLIGAPDLHPDLVSIYKEYKDSLVRNPPVE